MDSPMLNFVAAIAIGLIVGLVGGFILRGRAANSVWLAPVLAIVGSLVASVLAVMLGDDRQYGWKEASLQVVLAVAGVAITAFLASRSSTSPPTVTRAK